MTTVRRNPISSTVDFDREGKQHGFLRLPDSRDTSAWGSVMIPITVIRNGDGPTALMTGGNHGDEYEGPIALQSLAQALEPADIRGRVIIVPFMNFPAFQEARRTSPLDGGNLNRSFPGRPDGDPTEKIADYFLRSLVPMADAVLDIHSGGKTLDFLPFAAAHILDDAQQQQACIDAMTAFNAPYSMILREIDPAGMYDTAVEAAGKTFVTTEIGGGGTATAETTEIARKGVTNFLKHLGILPGVPEIVHSVSLDTTDPRTVHVAEADGLIEFVVDLGDAVEDGQVLARVWSAKRTGDAPIVVTAKTAGVLAARHFPGLIHIGDCLAVVARVG